MLASLIVSRRFKSLLVGFFFTAIALSHRNDPRLLAARRVVHHHHMTLKATYGDESWFAVVEAGIFERDARPAEHGLCIIKAEAVLG